MKTHKYISLLLLTLLASPIFSSASGEGFGGLDDEMSGSSSHPYVPPRRPMPCIRFTIDKRALEDPRAYGRPHPIEDREHKSIIIVKGIGAPSPTSYEEWEELWNSINKSLVGLGITSSERHWCLAVGDEHTIIRTFGEYCNLCREKSERRGREYNLFIEGIDEGELGILLSDNSYYSPEHLARERKGMF